MMLFGPHFGWLGSVVAQEEPLRGFPQNIPGWPVDTGWLDFLLTVVLFAALSLLAYWILFSVLRNLTHRSRRRSDDILVNTVRTPLLIFLITFGVLRSLEVLNLDAAVDSLIMTLFWSVVIATSFFLAWRIVREVLVGWLRHHARDTDNQIDDLLVPALNTLGPLLFTIAAVATIMSYLGIDVSLFLVSIGALGLILGLAFQDSLSNLFAGVYLLLNPPFHENDMIILPDGTLCTVQRVGLRMTQLYNLDEHALMFAPNNKLAGETIKNVTKPTADLSASIKVKTTPETDADQVKALLSDIMASHRNILNDPATKITTLRKRLEATAAASGAAAERLKGSLTDMTTWDVVSDQHDMDIRNQLRAVRRQLSAQVDRAQAELRTLQTATLPQQRELKHAIDNLALALRQTPADDNEAALGIDEGRMQQLSRTFDEVVAAADGQGKVLGSGPRFDLTSLISAMAAIGDLDYRENSLEAALGRRQQERDAQFGQLTAALQAAADEVATALSAQGHPKEAKRVQLWAENVAIAYAEQEVNYTVTGLDLELDELTAWLKEIEDNGITKDERVKIRSLFNGWGGVDQLERRRLDELRRRILHWLTLKEKDVIPAEEFSIQIEAWERRLRTLSRKLHDTRIGDEEDLDTRLQAIRIWIHGQDFLETIPGWKASSPGFNWTDFGYEFGLYYYVDDIRLDHYQRKGVVAAQLRGDIYEVFKHEKIEIAYPQRDNWVHRVTTEHVEGETNGRVRTSGIPRSQPPVS